MKGTPITLYPHERVIRVDTLRKIKDTLEWLLGDPDPTIGKETEEILTLIEITLGE